MIAIPIFQGHISPHKNFQICSAIWRNDGFHIQLWVHIFILNLGTLPQSSFLKEEMKRQTSDYDVLVS